MQEINYIPTLNPIHHQLFGDVELGGNRREYRGIELADTVRIGGVDVPRNLQTTLAKRCEKFGSIEARLDEKPLFLRGRTKGQEADWFGLVTQVFGNMPMYEIDTKLSKMFDGKSVRFMPGKSRAVANYKIADIPRPDQGSVEMFLFVDSGDFGLYGGNGQSALKTGVAIKDGYCLNWTRFAPDMAHKRLIHSTSANVDERVDKLYSFALDVHEAWDKSADVNLTRDEVKNYLGNYKVSAKKVFERVLSGFGDEISAYQLAWDLTKNAQDVADSTRMTLETMAGEVLLGYERIKEAA
jgi:hypothetical protein